MPLPDEIRANDREEIPANDADDLSNLLQDRVFTLDVFRATPSVAPPCGGPAVNLAWSIGVHPERLAEPVSRPAIPRVQFELSSGWPPHYLIKREGAMVVRPVVSTDYKILARIRQVMRVFGAVHVTVDESDCTHVMLQEGLIAPLVQPVIDKLPQDPRLQEAGVSVSLRSFPRFELDTQGIHLSLRFTFTSMEGSADVDIDAVLRVVVWRCQPKVTIPRWDIEADVPLLADIFSLGAADEDVEQTVTGLLQPSLTSGIETELKKHVDDKTCLCRVIHLPDAMDVTLCPRLPFVEPAPGPGPVA